MTSQLKVDRISPATGSEVTIDGFSAGGGLQSVQYFTSSGTWTKPDGITKIRVYVTGGGGSGSTRSGSNHNNGGWGGGTAIKFIDVSSISSANLTVGSGGPANTTAKEGGQNGGDSVWDDGTNVLIGGGGKGDGAWSSSASGGDMNIPGDSGSGYIGGASFWANRSYASHTISPSLHPYASSGNDPSVVGLGQGGRAYYSSGVTGYTGGNGIIVVEEYA